MTKYLVSIDEETGEEVGRTDVTDMRDTSLDSIVQHCIAEGLYRAFEDIEDRVICPERLKDVTQAIKHVWGPDIAFLWKDEWLQ